MDMAASWAASSGASRPDADDGGAAITDSQLNYYKAICEMTNVRNIISFVLWFFNFLSAIQDRNMYIKKDLGQWLGHGF